LPCWFDSSQTHPHTITTHNHTQPPPDHHPL